MALPALVLAAIKRRALLRLLVYVAGIMVPVLVMVMCGGLALVASAAQGSTTACLTTAPTAADTGGQSGRDSWMSIPSTSGPPTVMSTAQVTVARDYIGVGTALGVPDAGLEIAIMVSLQESGLRVLANSSVPDSMAYPHDGVGTDHDSLGTAQQRPSTGWGSVAELMNPAYDAQAFFGGPNGPNHGSGSPRGLLDITNWAMMSKGDAAQAVQASAFPELYAQWEGEAHVIVMAGKTGSVTQDCPPDPAGKGSPAWANNLSQLRRDVIKYAQAGVGGTYIWGGTAFKAWDCSGYVQWVYGQVGVKLPRTGQWLAGALTSTPQPGDLVVQNPDGPNHWGHVGIYAGNGMMFSALNPAVGTLLHPVAWNSGTQYFVLVKNKL